MDDKIRSGLKSLFEIAKNASTGVDQGVPEAVSVTRYLTCTECPSFIQLTGQCKECGCFTRLKTKIKQEKCPLGKWDAHK